MKTISLDDEAYRLLRGAKVTQADSFSDVVKRILGTDAASTLRAVCGTWADMTDAEYAALRRESRAAFEARRS